MRPLAYGSITPAGDVIVWEHLGMLGARSYRDAWEWKREWYAQNGYEEGRNLFTTRDREDGGDGIDGEDDVGGLDHDQGQQQRGGEQPAAVTDQEPERGIEVWIGAMPLPLLL